MLIYLVAIIFIIACSIILKYRNNSIENSDYHLTNNIYLTFVGSLLVIIAGFRGDFTSDYNGYINLFNFYNTFSFKEIFQNLFGQEIGFVLVNRIIGIFSKNGIYLMFITSFIIVLLFFREFKKYSSYIWFSVLMFVTVGSYYTSFNTIRQIMAASIIFSGSKYLYEKKLNKYILVILLATLFHKTSLIMIPFYFVLNFKFNRNKLVVAVITLLITMISLDKIIEIVQKYIYQFYTFNKYGMCGYSYKNVVLPLGIMIFVIYHYKKIDINNGKNNIWINAVIFYAFFSILGLKVQLIQRLSEFFAPYALLLVPLIISKINDKSLRVIYIIAAVIIMICYNFLIFKDTGYNPYYMFWQNHNI